MIHVSPSVPARSAGSTDESEAGLLQLHALWRKLRDDFLPFAEQSSPVMQLTFVLAGDRRGGGLAVLSVLLPVQARSSHL